MSKRYIDPDRVKREWFSNQRSYEAGVLSVQLANRIMELTGKTGYMIDGDVIHTGPVFTLESSHGGCCTLTLRLGKNSTASYWCTTDMDYKIYLTKKEVREGFSKVRIVPASAILKLI